MQRCTGNVISMFLPSEVLGGRFGLNIIGELIKLTVDLVAGVDLQTRILEARPNISI